MKKSHNISNFNKTTTTTATTILVLSKTKELCLKPYALDGNNCFYKKMGSKTRAITGIDEYPIHCNMEMGFNFLYSGRDSMFDLNKLPMKVIDHTKAVTQYFLDNSFKKL